jgi:hypothetical protein
MLGGGQRGLFEGAWRRAWRRRRRYAFVCLAFAALAVGIALAVRHDRRQAHTIAALRQRQATLERRLRRGELPLHRSPCTAVTLELAPGTKSGRTTTWKSTSSGPTVWVAPSRTRVTVVPVPRPACGYAVP